MDGLIGTGIREHVLTHLLLIFNQGKLQLLIIFTTIKSDCYFKIIKSTHILLFIYFYIT